MGPEDPSYVPSRETLYVLVEARLNVLMGIRILERISDLPAADWDALHDGGNPFLRHALLDLFESTGAASEANGWAPHHLVLEERGAVVGAVPLYRKTNSWGEFVFDWAWAHAYHRAGLPYYPKLLAGIPFTPVSGPRLLTGTGPESVGRRRLLARALVEELERLGDSSLHVNFVESGDVDALSEAGLLARTDVQFHWYNRAYESFQSFLNGLNAKRRKNIRRERRQVREAGIEFRRLAGSEATEGDWLAMHDFYRDTFLRHGNPSFLDQEFFLELADRLGDSALIIFALQNGQAVAGALFLRGADALYGRYWGTRADISGLHFETCYYQGIEYCIEHGLGRFEPGAQGEHKLLRGFSPVLTRSFHWIRHPVLREAIARSLEGEREHVHRYRKAAMAHEAFRRPSAPARR